MYLSAIIMVTGFSIIFNSILIAILMVVPTVLLHLQQIWFEEKYLIKILDEGQYQIYLKTVPALIPYKGKVGGIPGQGKTNWKRGLQRDIGPIVGLFIFIILCWIVLIFFRFYSSSLISICILTVVIDAILVINIQKKKIKREPFLQQHQ